eukprot:8024491-Pyramimonas_sp.AAC.1
MAKQDSPRQELIKLRFLWSNVGFIGWYASAGGVVLKTPTGALYPEGATNTVAYDSAYSSADRDRPCK